MAERIVSPGVFTREKDLSFLPQGIGEIGAALIGPTDMGPAFVPTIVRNFGEFEETFGKENGDFYVPFAAKQYLRNAGTLTIVRVLGLGGYKNDTFVLIASGSEASKRGVKVLATLKPSRGAGASAFIGGPTSGSINSSANSASAFTLELDTNNDGTKESFNLSFSTSSANYIGKVFSENPQDNNQPVYVYSNFQNMQNQVAGTDVVTFATGSEEDFSFDFKVASTPSIQSQLVNGARTNLFTVKTLAHGTNQNSKYRIGISDIKRAADVPGSDYGSFSLQVIVNNPGQNDDGTVLENFSNLNFDEESTNYLPRVVGDRFITVDSNGKLTTNGDYPNNSKYIRVADIGNLPNISSELVPMGFGAVSLPHVVALGTPSGSTVAATFPTASFKVNQLNSRNSFDSNVYYGLDFNSKDSQAYLKPLPTSVGTGSNMSMSLENMSGSADASVLGSTFADGTTFISLTNSALGQRKFAVPFQDGFDGFNPATERKSGTDIVGDTHKDLI